MSEQVYTAVSQENLNVIEVLGSKVKDQGDEIAAAKRVITRKDAEIAELKAKLAASEEHGKAKFGGC